VEKKPSPRWAFTMSKIAWVQSPIRELDVVGKKNSTTIFELAI
jgi:hypothetical protein